jgi:hypothetical protein
MSYQYDQFGDTPPLKVDGRKLWAGAVATALVAALVGIAGVLAIVRLLGIPILGARGGAVSNAIVFVPLVSALAAIACAALLHVLVMTTPRPRLFFGAICTAVIVVLMLMVFLLPGTLEEKIATALLYAIIGIVILTLLSGVARTAIRYDTGGPTAQNPTQAMRRDYPQ